MSSAGQGSLSFGSKVVTVPPFPAGAADNGLSVDPVTGRIVLGNDVGGTGAELLSNREIQHDGFLFQMLQTVGALNTHTLQVDPTGGLYSLGDYDSLINGSSIKIDDSQRNIILESSFGRMLYLDNLNDLYQFGEITGNYNNVFFQIDDNVQQATIRKNVDLALFIDFVNRLYFLGDNGVGSSTKLRIDDTNLITTIQDSFGGMLSLDRTGEVYTMGSLDNFNNGGTIRIDDISNLTTLQNNNSVGLSADYTNRVYRFGETTLSFNNTELILDDIAQTFQTLGRNLTDIQTFFFQAGDTTAAANGSQLIINDAGQLITAVANNGFYVQGSGQLIGSNTTLTNGAAASVGTLNNAPAAGDPTKWIPVDDNGTTRYLPAW